MPYTFQITDGTTTVDLSKQSGDTYAWIEEYYPSNSGRSTVTETAKVVFSHSSTLSTVLATIRDLEKLLRDAELYYDSNREYGSQVYVKYAFDGGATQRSPLTRENPDAPCGAVVYSRQALTTGMIARRFEVAVTFTRRNYWEADSESEVYLTSFATARAMGGVTIHDHNDSGHGNYVFIDDADVLGVEPAPFRLELTHGGSSSGIARVYIGHGFKGSDFPVHILEGESASGATPAVDANSSSGNDASASVSTSEADILTWAISAADMSKLAGRKYHALIRADTSNSGIYARLRLVYGSTTLAETPLVQLGANQLEDLGELAIPNTLAGFTDVLGCSIVLRAYKASAGTLYCDYIQLTPTVAYRELRALGGELPASGRIVDDGILDYLYQDTISGTPDINYFAGYGARPMLYPGRDQRLYFLTMNSDNQALIADSHTVRIYYRPRRLTL